MLKRMISCTLLMLTCMVWAENPNLDYPTDTIEGVVIYRYPVDRSIGLYRVSVNFAVPQSTIIEWNPFLKERGLQFGDTLYIPTGRPVVVEAAGDRRQAAGDREQAAGDRRQDTGDRLQAAGDREQAAGDRRQDTGDRRQDTGDSLQAAGLKLALLLPLQAQTTPRTEAMDRFLDFYEGCLLALKDEHREDQKIDLYLYDTGKDTETLTQLMNNELSQMDAIIGPAYPQQVEVLAPFVEEHAIKTMIPFTNEVPSVESNPYIYLFNTTPQMEADTFLRYLERRGELTNCVLVDGKEEDIHKDIRYIREQIVERNLPHTQTTLHDILADSVFAALKEGVENIVIFNTTKFANIQILLPHLEKGSGNNRIVLYSQYAWQKERILLPQVYSTIFSTDTLPALAEYETAYNTYFGHRHASLIPRYDLLGYDITSQFIHWLRGEEPTPGLQSDIRLQQMENGGYINTHITLVHK